MTSTESGSLTLSVREHAPLLESLSAPSAFNVPSTFNAICCSTNTCWKNIPIGDGLESSGWLNASRTGIDPNEFRDSPARWLEGRGAVIKQSDLGRVFAISHGASSEAKCFIKERLYRKRYERFVQGVGLSGLRRASRLGPRLLSAGISTPEVWGFVTVRCQRETAEYMVSECVPGGKSLLEFLAGDFGGLSGSHRRSFQRLLAENLAELIARLHLAGYENRDLKASNLMLTNPVGLLLQRNRIELTLIDLEGVRYLGRTPRFRRERDLARLNLSLLNSSLFSVSDRLRFLEKYLEAQGKGSWKPSWKRIGSMTRRRMLHATARGKPIH